MLRELVSLLAKEIGLPLVTGGTFGGQLGYFNATKPACYSGFGIKLGACHFMLGVIGDIRQTAWAEPAVLGDGGKAVGA